MKRPWLARGLLVLTPSLAGCHAIAGTNDFTYVDIVGSWESSVAVPGGNHHGVTMFGDQTGEGTFYIPVAGLRVPYAVGLVWWEVGEEFGVRVSCAASSCGIIGDSLFATVCRYLPDLDQLQCTTSDSGLPQPELTFVRTDD